MNGHALPNSCAIVRGENNFDQKAGVALVDGAVPERARASAGTVADSK